MDSSSLFQLSHMLVPIVAILSSIALPVGFGMYLSLSSIRAKHKENMELIKQGIIPPQKENKDKALNRYQALRNGMLLIGIGLGLIVGLIVLNTTDMGKNPVSAIATIAAPILLCLGGSYALFFKMTKNKDIDSPKD